MRPADAILPELMGRGVDFVEDRHQVVTIRRKPRAANFAFVADLFKQETRKHAQEAMRQGVSEYLLKTSGPDIIMKAAIRAKQRILQRREEFEQGQLEKRAFKNNILEQLVFKDQKPDEKQLADVEMFYPNLIVENAGDSLQVIFLSASNEIDHQALHLF